jgi:hypothetical protein
MLIRAERRRWSGADPGDASPGIAAILAAPCAAGSSPESTTYAHALGLKRLGTVTPDGVIKDLPDTWDAHDPTWSPDGREIAYGHPDGLFVIRPRRVRPAPAHPR